MAAPPTTVVIDQVRHLRIQSADMIALEEYTGKGWLQCLQERTERQLVAFVWVAARWRDERLTPQKVSEMLDVAREKGVTHIDLWEGIGKTLQTCGFLPKEVSANGRPTIAAESTPGPSPGGSEPSPTG